MRNSQNLDDQHIKSDLMVEIHSFYDFTAATPKKVVNEIGIPAGQAKQLIKGNIEAFNVFELKTFLQHFEK